ncbi:hypothetical protein C8J56DRAFT_1012155 [Mycena floridula]|nr:hypothetical protein C8J56DRAFT_1012155 [Mycena floridula]
MSDSPDSIVDSPSPAINIERSLFWGLIVMTGLYAIDVFMYCYSTQMFVSSSTVARRTARMYIILGAVILSLITVTVITDAVLLEFMWIDHRDTPGGPLAYFTVTLSAWWQVLSTVTSQVANACGDALLLYRCYIIYNGSWAVVAFPFIVYLGTLAMALVMAIQSANSDFFKGPTVNFGVPWIALSVTLNIVVTALILFRILKARRSMSRFSSSTSSRQSHGDVYTSLVAILIESSLPFSLLGLVAAVTYGKGIDEGAGFLLIWSAFAALSPQFIIFRVASGRAWTRNVASDMESESCIFQQPK